MPFFGKSGTSQISFFNPSQSTGLVVIWVDILVCILRLSSSNLKGIESGDRLGLGFFYVIYARCARPFLQTRPQPGQLLGCADGQHFDAAIGIVAHPSGNLQDVGFAFHEPAEAYALDASADKEATRSSARLTVGGSHRSIEEVRLQRCKPCAFGFT